MIDLGQGEGPFRVIVSGSRSTTPIQDEFVCTTLARVLGPVMVLRHVVIVEGECPYGGVDRAARRWADRQGDHARAEPHPADWDGRGRRAGPVRNGEMVAAGAALLIAFPGPDSRGTWDCLKRAVAAGIPGRIYPLPGPEA